MQKETRRVALALRLRKVAGLERTKWDTCAKKKKTHVQSKSFPWLLCINLNIYSNSLTPERKIACGDIIASKKQGVDIDSTFNSGETFERTISSSPKWRLFQSPDKGDPIFSLVHFLPKKIVQLGRFFLFSIIAFLRTRLTGASVTFNPKIYWSWYFSFAASSVIKL